VSFWLADIPRNLKISKHKGETNHLQYFDNALKQWSPLCGPCGLCELFPNICISLRIFLTIPATVASPERFFSKFELVKNYLRSAMCSSHASATATCEQSQPKQGERERPSKRHIYLISMHMEVRACFGRSVWRGVNIDDVTIHPS